MNVHAATTAATRTTAIVIRAVQVCGHRLTVSGSGKSTRPATGSAGGVVGLVWASAMRAPRFGVAAAASVPRSQLAEQMAELLPGILGGAERQHGDAEVGRPGEDGAQPFLRRRRDALAHAVAADCEVDLQLAVG